MSAREDITAPLLPGRYYHIFNRGNNKSLIFHSEENFRFFLRRYFQYSTDYWDTFGYCLIDNHFHILIGIKDETSLENKLLSDFKTINLTFLKHHIWPLLLNDKSEQRYWFSGEEKRVETRDEAGAEAGIETRIETRVENLRVENLREILQARHTDLTDLKDLLDLVREIKLDKLKTEILSWAVSERFRNFLLSYSKAFNKKYDRTGSLFQKAFRRKELTTVEDRKLVLAYIHHNPIHHGYCKDMSDYQWTSFHCYSSKPDNFEINYLDGLEWFGSYESFYNFSVMYQSWRQSHKDKLFDLDQELIR